MGGHRPNVGVSMELNWIATVGGMIRAGTSVRATCRKCQVCLDVDLAPLLMRLGDKGTLINRHPPCRVIGCGGTVIFSASPGEGTPFRPCIRRDC